MKGGVTRRMVLGLALVGTFALTWWASQRLELGMPTTGVVEAVSPSGTGKKPLATLHSGPVPDTEPVIQVARLDRGQILGNASAADPFKVLSWYVPPPPPPPVPIQVQKPKAPPFPFQYMGRYKRGAGSKDVIFLTRGEQSYSVGIGETFDEQYLLESETDGQLVFVYLPLGDKHILSLGTSP